MNLILSKLSVGDLRTTNASNEVVKQVLGKPELFNELFLGLTNDNPGIRMRSADALEKISLKKPVLLQPFKKQLLEIGKNSTQQEVQWHIAQMLAYLEFTPKEREEVIKILNHYLGTTKSNIVKVFSLQTLTELCEDNPKMRNALIQTIIKEMRSGSPAVISRGQKLLKRLNPK